MGSDEQHNEAKDDGGARGSSSIEDELAEEAEELDGYFSDTPLDPKPKYPPIDESFDASIIITNLPKVPQSKLDKLTKVVLKLVSRIGPLATTGGGGSGESKSGDEDDDGNNEEEFSGVMMPYDEEKKSTLGFCMVEFEKAEHALNAVDVLKDYRFDKNHRLSVTSYNRSRQLKDLVTTEFKPPDIQPFDGETKPNPMEWLYDPNQRDSYVVRFEKETVVYWYDGGKTDPVVDYDGHREKNAGVQWCEYYCYFSPAGSYLATLVPQRGVILWSGKTYEKTGRFVAPGVKHVTFSPQETFLLTNNENPDDPAAIKVYHIPTGKLLRAFPLYPEKFTGGGSGGGDDRANTAAGEGGMSDPNDGADGEPPSVPPPPFLWSHDDKYIARMGKGIISIYETPGMKLLDKRSLPCPGIREFQWCPTANIIVYWAPEANNSPAHVDLIEIPSRTKLRQKNLFNVTRCNMVWQDSGEYLAVKVTRHTKSKKTHYNNIELFRLGDVLNSMKSGESASSTTPSSSGANTSGGGVTTTVPVEMLDIKDAVMALAWEPRGSRFAMIHAENPGAAKVSVSFYDMLKTPDGPTSSASGAAVGVGGASIPGASLVGTGGSKKGKQQGKQQQQQQQQQKLYDGGRIAELNHVETLESRQCNLLFWSPAGSTMLMASLGDSASGTLEFYDLDAKTMVVKEHYRANQVLWDPDGRTVATVVSQPIGGGHFKFAMDNGYILWSFQGKQLYQQSYETFYQFVWRPRKRLLDKSQVREVRKSLKKYEKLFDRADRKRQRQKYLEETKGKRMDRNEFRQLLARNKAIRTRQRKLHVELHGGYDSDDEKNYHVRDVTVETILSTKDEVVV